MNRFKRPIKSTFLKNVLMITSGTAFAQILGIALLPLITRLYSPEQYGLISVYTAFLGMISILGSMNYEMGIPIAESEKKAINILTLSIITLMMSTCFLVLVFVFIGDELLILSNSKVLIEYKYFIPIGVLFVGLYNIFTQWAYRRKDFKIITKTKFSQAISQNLITIGFGILGNSALGLILGKVLGQSAGISTLLSSVVKRDRNLFKKISKRAISWTAKRYIKFPLYTTPRRFLGDITISLPILFITSLYGTQTVGLFGLANSVIQLPMNLIGTSVSNVFYAESASLRSTNPKQVKKLSNKLLKNLILIGTIPLITLVFWGPSLFSIVFGSEWHDAGVYAGILSFAVFSRFVFKPISNIFDVYEKQRLALILNIFRLFLVILVFGFSSYLSLNSYWAVGLYSVTMSIVYLAQYLLAQKILNDQIDIFENKG